MSAFVNYHSRKVELPEGCKDLIDVLNLAHASGVHPSEMFKGLPDVAIYVSQFSAPEAKTFQGLGDVTTYVSQFSASAAKFKFLGITCSGDATTYLSISCGNNGLRVLVLAADADRTQAVRAIFADSGISPLQDKSYSNNVRLILYPLSSISGLDQFVRELLTKGFSVTQDTDLLFHFHEKDES